MRKDGDDDGRTRGNSALHIAVANKHIEMVRYLVKQEEIEVNGLNKNRLTALELLRQSPRDMEIEYVLVNAAASTAKDLQLILMKWLGQQGNKASQTRQSSPRTGLVGSAAP